MKEFSENKSPGSPGPLWSDRPPPGPTRGLFAFVRPVWGSPLTVVALADDVVGVMLHADSLPSSPCLGPDCDLDHESHPPRWHGYLAVAVVGLEGPRILGVSPAAFGALDRLAEEHDGLRGLRLRLTRQSADRQARVLVALTAPDKATGLPAEPDIRPALLERWGLTAAAEALRGDAQGGGQSRAAEEVRRVIGGLFFLPPDAKGGVA